MFKTFAAALAACLIALFNSVAASAAVLSAGTIDNTYFGATGSEIKTPGTYDLTFFTTADIQSQSVDIAIRDKWRIFFDDGGQSGCDHCFLASVIDVTPYANGLRARFTIPEPITTVFDTYTKTDAYSAVILLQARFGEEALGTPYQLYYSAAPEPGAWALMIGGFALCGLGLRRNRASLAASL